MKTIKELIYNDDNSKKDVRFTHYYKGNLWYQTEDGFEFPVPIEDIGDAVFRSVDSAPLFMRYIRKHLDLFKELKQLALDHM